MKYSRSPYSVGGTPRNISPAYSKRAWSLSPYSRSPGRYSPPYEEVSSDSSDLEFSAQIFTTIITSGVVGIRSTPQALLQIASISSALVYATPAFTTTITPPVLTASLELTAKNIYKAFIDLASYPVTRVSIGKGIQDQLWTLDVDMEDYQQINTTSLRHCTFADTDHNGVSRTLFSGIIPKTSISLLTANTSTGFSGYDFAWYLNQQYVPAEYLHNTAGTNPALVIDALLGGVQWEDVTGIFPYNINSVSEWGNTLNSRVFDFDITTTKWKAIEKICNYCRYMFVVKWVLVEGVAFPAAYFIHENDIDTDLDLPGPATFSWPDPFVEGKVSIETKGDERYNRVTVIGRDNAGSVFTDTVESDSVMNGDELAIEHIENSGAWTTQAQVTARANEIYGYYSAAAVTYKAKLIDRLDLELYQKIYFSGFAGVAETAMRITHIRYTIDGNEDGVLKRVEITFTDDNKWNALRRMYRYQDTDLLSETETIVDDKIRQIPGPQLGTVASIDGQTADIVLESGQTVTTRNV